MDWDEFFEKTRVAAGVDSFSKLAPKLGITDGAIGHYRRGRQIPSVWVVADALRIQGHPNPEIAAVEIMRNEARTSSERTFWKRLRAVSAMLLCAIGVGLMNPANASPHKAMAALSTGSNFDHSVYYVKIGCGGACWGLASGIGCLPRTNTDRMFGNYRPDVQTNGCHVSHIQKTSDHGDRMRGKLDDMTANSWSHRALPLPANRSLA